MGIASPRALGGKQGPAARAAASPFSPKTGARCRFAWVSDSQLRGSPRARSGRRGGADADNLVTTALRKVSSRLPSADALAGRPKRELGASGWMLPLLVGGGSEPRGG